MDRRRGLPPEHIGRGRRSRSSGFVGAASTNGKVSRLDADGWTHFDAESHVQIGDLEPGPDDDVWLIGGQERPTLVHFDGSGWNVEEPAGIPFDHRATLIEMAADGSLWAYFRAGEMGTGYLGRYQDGEWTVFSPEDGVPKAGGFLSGMGAPGLMEVAPDGRLWLTPGGDRGQTGCDGLTSFDGQTWTGFLSGECIYGLDAAEDGTLWLLAGRPERDGDRPGDSHTYVITPEPW